MTHRELSDIVFLEQFKNCTLNTTIFNHEAHLRLAWILLKEIELEIAMKSIQIHLRNFVEAVGAADKYNTTVTIASMKVVHHFMRESRTKTFQEFISENIALKNNFKELIGKHYSIDIFNSEKAKSNYLKPDLLPF